MTEEKKNQDKESIEKFQQENADLKKQIEQLKQENEALKKQQEPYNLPLAVKIAKANQEFGALEKDGNNRGQNFKFISESQIKSKVREFEGKYGFTIIPTKADIIKRYEKKTSRGGLMYFYDVVEEFTITDGKESIKGQMVGTGSDTGDKTVNKAVTIALKNFEKQLFNVSDQQDPDAQSTPTTYDQAPQQEVKPRQSQQQSKKIDYSHPEKLSDAVLRVYSIVVDGKSYPITTICRRVAAGSEKAKKIVNNFNEVQAKVFYEVTKRNLMH